MAAEKQIRISTTTKDKLENLSIEVSWIELKTFDKKISFLLWYYANNKQRNSADLTKKI